MTKEADLSHYQASYDVNNKRVAAPTPEAQNLIPPIRKHTYAPDIEPSTLISDEAMFQALTGIDWTTVDFQPLGRDEKKNRCKMTRSRQVKLLSDHNLGAGLTFHTAMFIEKQLFLWVLKRLIIG